MAVVATLLIAFGSLLVAGAAYIEARKANRRFDDSQRDLVGLQNRLVAVEEARRRDETTPLFSMKCNPYENTIELMNHGPVDCDVVEFAIRDPQSPISGVHADAINGQVSMTNGTFGAMKVGRPRVFRVDFIPNRGGRKIRLVVEAVAGERHWPGLLIECNIPDRFHGPST